MRLDGSAPLILYAYGAYGTSEPADFDAKRISLLDRSMPVGNWSVAGELQGYNVRVNVTPSTSCTFEATAYAREGDMAAY